MVLFARNGYHTRNSRHRLEYSRRRDEYASSHIFARIHGHVFSCKHFAANACL